MSEKCEVCGQAVDEIEKKVCKILSSKHEIPEEACRELMDLRAKNYIDEDVLPQAGRIRYKSR